MNLFFLGPVHNHFELTGTFHHPVELYQENQSKHRDRKEIFRQLEKAYPQPLHLNFQSKTFDSAHEAICCGGGYLGLCWQLLQQSMMVMLIKNVASMCVYTRYICSQCVMCALYLYQNTMPNWVQNFCAICHVSDIHHPLMLLQMCFCVDRLATCCITSLSITIKTK